MIRVAAFTKYDREAASTRQRVLQYCPALSEAGIEVTHFPLLSNDYVRGIATGERQSRTAIARAYARRMGQLATARAFDVLWVYAETFPYLPAAFEKLAFLPRRPLIYDFDDAFFQPYADHPNPIARSLLAGKLEPLLRGAAACCCGNDYLADYARRLCDTCLVVPTVVDTSLYRPRSAGKERAERVPTIGWIGSPSTWINVRPLIPLLERVGREQGWRIRVVGAGVAAASDTSDMIDFVEWSEDREIAEVQAMDIGIMPLLDLPFQRGKSGYKIVQYMACGAPVVASPVGVNSVIVSEGQTGLLATSESEWERALRRLIGDPELRRRMGEAGRARAVADYSLASQAPRLVELFRSVAKKGR